MCWFLRMLGIAYAAIVCGSTAMQAQHRSPSFRTDAVQAIAISTWNMEAVGGGITGAQNANFYRYLTRGVLNLIAAVSAPQGSLLTCASISKRATSPSVLRRHPERSEGSRHRQALSRTIDSRDRIPPSSALRSSG